MNQPRQACSGAAALHWIACCSERYRWRRRLLAGLHVTSHRTFTSLCCCSALLHMGWAPRRSCVTQPDHHDMWGHKSLLRHIGSHVLLSLGEKDKIEMRTRPVDVDEARVFPDSAYTEDNIVFSVSCGSRPFSCYGGFPSSEINQGVPWF